MKESEITRRARENYGEHLMRTEWVGSDGLVWTWQDDSDVLDTRSAGYRTKAAALASMEQDIKLGRDE